MSFSLAECSSDVSSARSFPWWSSPDAHCSDGLGYFVNYDETKKLGSVIIRNVLRRRSPERSPRPLRYSIVIAMLGPVSMRGYLRTEETDFLGTFDLPFFSLCVGGSRIRASWFSCKRSVDLLLKRESIIIVSDR